MGSLSRGAAKLRYLLTRSDANRDFDEELQAHLHLLAERYERQGMEKREAWNAARRQFGNGTSLKEARARMQTFQWLETLARDVRFSLRSLGRNPAVACAASCDSGARHRRQLHNFLDGEPLPPYPSTRG